MKERLDDSSAIAIEEINANGGEFGIDKNDR